MSVKNHSSCELDSTTVQTSRAEFNDIFPPSQSHPPCTPHDFPYTVTSPPEIPYYNSQYNVTTATHNLKSYSWKT